MKKKTLAMSVLSAVLLVSVFSFAGCSSGSSGNTQESTPAEEESALSYVYVLEDMDWGLEDDGNGYYSNYGSCGHKILQTHTVYSEEGTTEELLILDLDTGLVETIPYERGENSYIYNLSMRPDSQSAESETGGGGLAASAAAFAVLEASYEDDNTAYTVQTLDQDGTMVSEFVLDDLMAYLEEKNGYGYISDFVWGGDGNFYLGCESSVMVYDSEGGQIAELEVPNWLNSLILSQDGRVFATYYDSGYQLAFINLETETLEQLDFGVTSFSSGTINVLEDDSVVYGDSSGLNMYRYDAQTGETETLFDWVSLDVVGYNVDAVYYLDEDNMVVRVYDYTANSYNETMARVVRRESSEVTEKTILTLALFSADSYTQEYVVAFNKASDQYRIEMKTYLDYSTIDYNDYQTYYEDAVTRMQNDLVTGEGADIIMTGYGVNAGTLADNGLLEDLVPYLDERGYTRDQFVTQVYDAYLDEGELYFLPAEFVLRTVYALTDVAGTESGWTLAEAAEAIQNLPEGMQWLQYETRDSMLNELLTYGYGSFINEEDNTCSFDTEEFKALLELAAAFPEDYEYDMEGASEPTMIQNGQLAASEAYIYDLEELQLYRAIFEGKDYIAVGYPGLGGNGTLISSSGSTYAISSKSQYKDAAADFIVSTLTAETTWGGFGFSVLQEELDQYFEEETAVEYLLDENGDPVLDENGETIIGGTGSGIGYQDGWEYWYEPCTEEDIEEFYELLNGAVAVSATDNSEILAIIEEEADSFFSGQKSVDDVAAIIQNRVSLYLSENS
ncbi:MAG: extracellular solute-binding protein [Lachnospiraceae bacterium]|nr:extracellular solute-binding protein [Lachnospiraceae bacterium]